MNPNFDLNDTTCRRRETELPNAMFSAAIAITCFAIMLFLH